MLSDTTLLKDFEKLKDSAYLSRKSLKFAGSFSASPKLAYLPINPLYL